MRLSFGATGQRRNEDTWSGNPTSGDWTGITNTARRGFTSHKMLDNLNMTHMNGRIYDQLIGRFISADPRIDGAATTQGWNRYSFVHNNALSFTDPSGYTKSRNIVSWINHDLPPGIEGVVVTGSRGGWDTNSTPAAALHGSHIRGSAPDGMGGGGGRGRGHGDQADDCLCGQLSQFDCQFLGQPHEPCPAVVRREDRPHRGDARSGWAVRHLANSS